MPSAYVPVAVNATVCPTFTLGRLPALAGVLNAMLRSAAATRSAWRESATKQASAHSPMQPPGATRATMRRRADATHEARGERTSGFPFPIPMRPYARSPMTPAAHSFDEMENKVGIAISEVNRNLLPCKVAAQGREGFDLGMMRTLEGPKPVLSTAYRLLPRPCHLILHICVGSEVSKHDTPLLDVIYEQGAGIAPLLALAWRRSGRSRPGPPGDRGDVDSRPV